MDQPTPAADLRAAHTTPLDLLRPERVAGIVRRVVTVAEDEQQLDTAKFSSVI